MSEEELDPWPQLKCDCRGRIYLGWCIHRWQRQSQKNREERDELLEEARLCDQHHWVSAYQQAAAELMDEKVRLDNTAKRCNSLVKERDGLAEENARLQQVIRQVADEIEAESTTSGFYYWAEELRSALQGAQDDQQPRTGKEPGH